MAKKHSKTYKLGSREAFWAHGPNVAIFVILMILIVGIIVWVGVVAALSDNSPHRTHIHTTTAENEIAYIEPMKKACQMDKVVEGDYLEIESGSSNNYLLIQNKLSWLDHYTNGFTVSYWLNLPHEAGKDTVINLFGRDLRPLQGDSIYSVHLIIKQGKPNMVLQINKSIYVAIGGIKVANWTHISYSIEVDKERQFKQFTGYLNGIKLTPEGSKNISVEFLPMTSICPLILVSREGHPVMQVKNLAVFNSVLSNEQIKELAKEQSGNTKALAISGILGAWLMGNKTVSKELFYNQLYPSCINGNIGNGVTIKSN